MTNHVLHVTNPTDVSAAIREGLSGLGLDAVTFALALDNLYAAVRHVSLVGPAAALTLEIPVAEARPQP